MGITIIQKSDLTAKKEHSKVALVLAGGAISGGAFKIGGLKALNDYLINRKLTEFDIYVGLSAGSVLAIPLSGGTPPEEMLASLDGRSKKYSQLSPFDMYTPNLGEFIRRPIRYAMGHISYLPGVVYDLAKAYPRLNKENFFDNLLRFIKKPTYLNYETLTRPLLKIAYSTRSIPGIGELIPSGIFDNKPLELYLRRNMKHNKMPNNFRVLKRTTGRSLYMTAMNLDTSENVVFGPDEKSDITISEAAQASCAIPGFYKPARLKGVDYIDGGVRKTANIDLAFEKGADLVICYNPFRPYNNKIFLEYLREENKFITKNKRLADWGMGMIFNQVFRTLFHSRLQFGVANLTNDPGFKKDLILIEPTEYDNDFFTMNPLFFWNRAKAARLGFDSVTNSINRHYDEIAKILAAYGIHMSKDDIESENRAMKNAPFDDQVIMGVLESAHPAKKLHMIRGGKSLAG